MNANDFTDLRERLDAEVHRRECALELSSKRPDPLMVARDLDDDRAILLCALFGYGNAGRIVTFLRSLDFSLLDADEREIRKGLEHRYRFQSPEDVVQIFLTLRRAGHGAMEEIFMEGYRRNHAVIDGVFELIEYFGRLNGWNSRGYRFLTSTVPADGRPRSAYKRWMMFLRWMVRKEALDLGRWRGVDTADLIMPLDTHTFRVSRRLGLLKRKSCDWKAAVELTRSLKRFCPEDPVRYDFALYRIGQEKAEL
ncbi:TIGR02757 family protein [Hydrogenimonas urashimensis]|uniref:TIGR02757 family protein n=1 Tax=Hydrogenimonas urashimensis TaxID=2740515 RepID=UPI001F3050A6|nr:TIGR02757 family protein [Hydrogenimonas urashimensis]